MLSEQALEKLKSLADEVSRREGCELYDIEFTGHANQRTLRVFIDSEAAPVSVDQCANVSRGLSLLLDVQDIIPGDRYELEVSSPGVERPLKSLRHFQRAVGEMVKIITHEPIPGLKGEVKSLTGALRSAVAGKIEIEYQNQNVPVLLENVKRAQVIFSLGGSPK